jgi:hypothetical protein
MRTEANWALAQAELAGMDTLAEPCAEWNEHEHLPPALRVEAEKLISQAGSAEMAKQAIDRITDTWVEDPKSRHDKFAREWGFASYLSLLQCSMSISATHEKNWCVTAVSGGRWIMWNDEDLEAIEHFRSLESHGDSQENV